MVSPRHIKFALLSIGVLLTASLTWNGAQGQVRFPRGPNFRPPMGPNNRPPMGPIGPGPIQPIRPGMPGGFPNNGPPMMQEKIWTCSRCGGELGRGLAAPPDRCPKCGAHIVNGVPGGIPQPGMPGQITPPNPAMPPGGINPNPPPFAPVVNNAPANTSSDSSSSGKSPKWLIPMVIGLIVVGFFVLLGGALLVVYAMRSSGGSSSSSRRRRRRDDYDDDY